MSRKPIGERAMTPAERQRRRREKLGVSGPHFLLPAPWLGEGTRLFGTRHDAAIINGLHEWLETADAKEVAKMLAFSLSARDDYEAVLDATRQRVIEVQA